MTKFIVAVKAVATTDNAVATKAYETYCREVTSEISFEEWCDCHGHWNNELFQFDTSEQAQQFTNQLDKTDEEYITSVIDDNN